MAKRKLKAKPRITKKYEAKALRRVLRFIGDRYIRRDFRNAVNGLEYCMAIGDRKSAKTYLTQIALSARTLHRTIGDPVAAALICGAVDDGKKYNIGFGFVYRDGHRCNRDNTNCLPAPIWRCLEHETLPGCAGSAFPEPDRVLPSKAKINDFGI